MSDSSHNDAWRQNVAAIIMDDGGNILLGGCPESNAWWHFPQGGVKAQESATEALQREIREEVGLNHCTILASYAGLRYAYRSKNKKSKLWRGQQQTYYLLHCPGIMPPTNPSGSVEFTATRWVPRQQLTPEMFISFKREVIARALAYFFPDVAELSPESIRRRCGLCRYLYRAGDELCDLSGTPLFGGGKDEAAYHLDTLKPLRPCGRKRFLVLLAGMEGAGLKKALRSIASGLDPLSTHYWMGAGRYREAPTFILPRRGELSILALQGSEMEELAHLQTGDDVHVLRVGLYVSEAKQLKRLQAKGKQPSRPWEQQRADLLALMQSPHPWYLLPTEHGWYRDFLLAELVRDFISTCS